MSHRFLPVVVYYNGISLANASGTGKNDFEAARAARAATVNFGALPEQLCR